VCGVSDGLLSIGMFSRASPLSGDTDRFRPEIHRPTTDEESPA
jgi:hypothetical protein